MIFLLKERENDEYFVTVIGSINLDRTIRVTYMPKPGETIHTKETFFQLGGGKGQPSGCC